MKNFLKRTLLMIPLFMAMNAFVLPGLVNYDYLPIVHFDKQPIIEGVLNGKKAFFMLDSGSQLSLLNSSEATSYDFAISRRGPEDKSLSGVGGEGDKVKYAFDSELGLGMQDKIEVSFYAYKLDHLFGDMEAYKPVGIIGGDLMKAYGFQIDFKNKYVRIRKINP